YKDFFISYDSYDDLTPEECNIISRHRISDILAKFQTVYGEKFVWSTQPTESDYLSFQKSEL
ncbi:MAG: hypothetical protein AABY49_01530, partial [Planctomycetota bacterium]